MHNAVVSVWVRFGLKERAASKLLALMRLAELCTMKVEISKHFSHPNYSGAVGSHSSTTRGTSPVLRSVSGQDHSHYWVCMSFVVRGHKLHTHTHTAHQTQDSSCCEATVSHRAAQTVSVYLYPSPCECDFMWGWRSEVKSGRFWKRARESDRHRGEEAESWSWQFHSDHLNVQTISALIREPRRCMCVCRWLPFTPESIHTLSCILAQLTRGMVRWSSQNTTWQQLPWEGWVSLLTLPTHTPSFSSCAKIQIHNLLDTSPPQLNARLSDCLQLGLNLQVNCDQHWNGGSVNKCLKSDVEHWCGVTTLEGDLQRRHRSVLDYNLC